MRFIKLSTLIALAILPLLSGCSAVGAILYKVAPAEKAPAVYTPAKELSVIVVENARNPGSNEIDCQQLARLIADEFRENKVVPLVEDNAVTDLRDRDSRAFKGMSIPEIGRQLGAKQIFYVDLQKSSIEPIVGNQMVQGTITATVRVIDVKSGDTRWPTDTAAGWPLSMETGMIEVNAKFKEATLRRNMHQSIAVRVGRLFHPWVNDDEGSEVH